METLCREAGIRFEAVPPLSYDGSPISSTRIRELLQDGRVEDAAVLLGERYTIDFPVAHGRQLGRKMGFPTINQLYPKGSLLPKFGVYAPWPTSTDRITGVLPILVSSPPLQAAMPPLPETYLMDYRGDLYGRRIPLSLVAFLRPRKTL